MHGEPTNKTEIKAKFDLLNIAGLMRDAHSNANDFWSTYRTGM